MKYVKSFVFGVLAAAALVGLLIHFIVGAAFGLSQDEVVVEENGSNLRNASNLSYERFDEAWDKEHMPERFDRSHPAKVCFRGTDKCVVKGNYTRWWHHVVYRPPWGLVSMIFIVLAYIAYLYSLEVRKEQ